MRIDLFYYTPYFNDYYFVYGPEKDSSGDIIIKPTGYYFADVNDMVVKLRSMADSLAPEITNVQARNQGNSFWIYVGDLNSGSESPDYTQILTNINTNLTNLNSKFNCTANSNSNVSIANLISNIFQYDNGSSSMRLNDIGYSGTKLKGNIVNLLSQLVNSFSSQIGISDEPFNISDSKKILHLISTSLKQSVTPNANITDVISALNTTIDSKQDTTIVNNEVTPLAEINIDVPFEVKNLKKSDVENL